MVEEAIEGGDNQLNGLKIELELKNSKAWSSKIKMVVCVNKIVHP
jgi:hypothetical protein